jgi:hypothetical protein
MAIQEPGLMSDVIERATALAERLERDIEAYPRDGGSGPQRKQQAKQIIRQGTDLIEAIRRAHRELETNRVRLDDIDQKVISRLNPEIDHIYHANTVQPNPERQEIESLYKEYRRARDAVVVGAVAMWGVLQAPLRLPRSSARTIAAANAVLIGGILGALAFSRLEITPHAAAFFGFLVGSVVVILAEVISFDGGGYLHGRRDKSMHSVKTR